MDDRATIGAVERPGRRGRRGRRGGRGRRLGLLVARRLLVLPLVLLAVATGCFALVAVSPYNPGAAYSTALGPSLTQQAREDNARIWGLDDSMPQQFVRWLGNTLQGDLGDSRLLGGQPVAEEIAKRAWPSFVLVATALALVLVLGLVCGVLAAALRDRPVDWLVRGVSYFSISAPSFWLGLLGLYVFSVWLGWLPPGGASDSGDVNAPTIDVRYLVLPAITLAITQMAWFTLFVRDTMLEVLRDDHVRFAEVSGVSRAALVVRHALPCALIPFVTLIGTHLSELIGGAVLAETIFGWPGVGQLAVEAAVGVDIPLLLAITLAGSVLVVLGNLLADVLYPIIDPRVQDRST